MKQRVMFCYNAVIRQFMIDHDGYECNEDNGEFMVAFKSPVRACYWAIAVHISFLKMDWSKEPKAVSDALKELGSLLGIGIHSGIPEAIRPHALTGRADYFGSFVNLAARVGQECEEGDVFLSSSAFQNLPAEHNLKVDVGEKVNLRGIQDKVQLYELLVPEDATVEAKDHEYAKWKKFEVDSEQGEKKGRGLFGNKKDKGDEDAGSSGTRHSGPESGVPGKELIGEDAVVANVFSDAQGKNLGAWRIDPGEVDLESGFYIASGAFGDVRTGTFRGTMVAIKTLKRERVDEQSLERFKQELILCRDLRHPNIMQILGGCWDSADALMLVAEFCEKGSLGKLLRREGGGHKLLSTKLRWISEIAKAMCYLHGFRPPIMHRDLKADNVRAGERKREGRKEGRRLRASEREKEGRRLRAKGRRKEGGCERKREGRRLRASEREKEGDCERKREGGCERKREGGCERCKRGFERCERGFERSER